MLERMLESDVIETTSTTTVKNHKAPAQKRAGAFNYFIIILF